jgi:hypothetical protein
MNSNSMQQTELASKPVSVAFMLGASDAEAGDLCVPHMYFVRRMDQIVYSLGHESVAGVTLLSSQYTKSVNWERN